MTNIENNLHDQNNEITTLKNKKDSSLDSRLNTSSKLFNYVCQKKENPSTQSKTYMPKSLIPCPFPSCDPKKKLERHLKTKTVVENGLKISNAYQVTKIDGKYRTIVVGTSDHGLPWGHIPRLLISQFTTDAIQNRTKVLKYRSIFHLCQLIGIDGTGRAVQQARDQIKAFRYSSIFVTEFEDEGAAGAEEDFDNLSPVAKWSERRRPRRTEADKARPISDFEKQVTIHLGDGFYNEVVRSSVPFIMNDLIKLKKSTLTMDVYTSIITRAFNHWKTPKRKRSLAIPYKDMFNMFVNSYENERAFKFAFKKALKDVSMIIYPNIKINFSNPMTPDKLDPNYFWMTVTRPYTQPTSTKKEAIKEIDAQSELKTS